MPELKSKKLQLLERFDFAKMQGLDLIDEISQYATENKCYDKHFMQGYTFKSGLEVLQKERDSIFNNGNRDLILNINENSTEMDFLIKKIEEQINHHGEIRFGLNIFFKSRN